MRFTQVNPHCKGECPLLFDCQGKLNESKLCTTHNHYKHNELDKTPITLRFERRVRVCLQRKTPSEDTLYE